MICIGGKFALELQELDSSAPLSHGSMMLLYGLGVLPCWNKKLIRRWDSERELSDLPYRPRTTANKGAI